MQIFSHKCYGDGVNGVYKIKCIIIIPLDELLYM